MISGRRSYVIAVAAFLWFVTIVTLYYWPHKPISPEMAIRSGITIGRVVIVISVLSVCGALGSFLLPNSNYSPLVKIALQAAFGMGAVSVGILILGSTIGFNAYYAWGSLIVLVLVLRSRIYEWFKSLSKLFSLWSDSGLLGKSIGLGVAILCLFSLSDSLAPPLKFDALVYHLVFPRDYLDSGGINYISHNMFWGMPQVTEMLYTWGMALAGVETATTLGWGIGVLTLLGILGYASELLGVRVGWVAVASLMAGYTTVASLAWGYVDWIVILFGFGFLVAIHHWRVDGARRDLIIAGIFSGLAVGAKYTAGLLIVAGVFIIIWRSYSFGMKQLITNLLWFSLSLFLLSAPWWFKNILATGNPLYPFFFPSGNMTALRLELYPLGKFEGGWHELLLLPLLATVLGVEGAEGYSASIGPLLLGLGVLAWMGWKEKSRRIKEVVKTSALIVIVGLVIWITASHYSIYLLQTRLYFAILPAIAVLAGAGFSGFDKLKLPNVRLGWVVGIMVLIVMVLNLIQVGISSLQKRSLLTIVGIQGRESYLAENLGWYAPAMKAIRDLPTGSRVLMLWEPRSFYCQPKCYPDEVLDRWLIDLANQSNIEAILQSWIKQGYTHLLVHRSGVEFLQDTETSVNPVARYQPEEWQALERLLDKLPTPEYFGQAYELYSLVP